MKLNIHQGKVQIYLSNENQNNTFKIKLLYDLDKKTISFDQVDDISFDSKSSFFSIDHEINYYEFLLALIKNAKIRIREAFTGEPIFLTDHFIPHNIDAGRSFENLNNRLTLLNMLIKIQNHWGLYFSHSNFSDKDVNLSLRVSYFDNIQEGYYSLRLCASDSADFIGILSKRSTAQEAGMVYVTAYNASNCVDCCTPEYKYAGIKKDNYYGAVLVGSKADIYTKYGQKLCGEVTDTIYASSVIWVAVSYDTVSYNNFNSVWALAGYGKIRLAGFTDLWKVRISEMEGLTNYDFLIDINHPDTPPINETHEFKIELDLSLSQWISYYDNIPYNTLNFDHFGQQLYGSYSRYSGEIRNIEDDMAGTVYDKCTISNCAVKKLG